MISIHLLLWVSNNLKCDHFSNVFIFNLCMEGAKGNGSIWVLVYLHQVLIHLTVITDSCITNHCFLMQSVHVRRERSLPLTKSSVLYSKLTCLVLQEWVVMLRQVTVWEESVNRLYDWFIFLFDEFVVYLYVWGHMHLSTARNCGWFALFCIHNFILAMVLSLNEI